MHDVVLDTLEQKESYEVVFNLLKKIIDHSYSTSPVIGIHTVELNIANKDCLLLRIKDRDLFFVNPYLIFCGQTLTIFSDNMCLSFEGKEKEQILFYFYFNKYLDRLKKVYV